MMWNKICIIIIFLVILAGCKKEIDATLIIEDIPSQNDLSLAEDELSQPQEGDIRNLDEVELTNISRKDPVKTYKLGDTILGLRIEVLDYEQIYSENEWVDSTIAIKFSGNLIIDGDLLIENNYINAIISSNNYDQIPSLALFESTQEKFHVEPINDYLETQLIELSNTEPNIPESFFDIEGTVEIPFVTLMLDSFSMEFTRESSLIFKSAFRDLKLSDMTVNTTWDYLTQEYYDGITWMYLPQRKLDYTELSLNGIISDRLQVNDNFNDFKILHLNHDDFFWNGEWYDGNYSIHYSAEMTITGNLNLSNNFYGTGIVQLSDDEYNNLPHFMVDNSIGEDGGYSFAIINNDPALGDSLKSYYDIGSDEISVENISFTVSEVYLSYGVSGPAKMNQVIVASILDNKTGEVIYSAPTEVEHAE